MNTDAAVWRTVQTEAAFRRSIWEVDEERCCCWGMDRKVDRYQQGQRGEKGYGTRIRIAQDGQQTAAKLRRSLGLTGYG